ncbi:hypothetical protein M0R45_023575 [Rubus argutus]|uniref:non-specific serine/threonine protein kinase n=1 Tax=Rubus argutus TaxID=59490 RepID=A0AAW1WRQ9_RUBAR
MPSPISYLLAALLLLFFFFNFHGSKANFSPSKNCPIYNCTKGPKFHYPFWKIEDSAAAGQYCGYRGFGLSCSSGEPILTLPNNGSFYVRDIDFPEYTITLVDIDVVDQKCPRARHNISVGTLPFHYSPSDVNLSFYFNCSTTSYLPPWPVPPISCLPPSYDSYGGITNQSFVFKEGEEEEGFEFWSEKCAEKVVVTVMKEFTEASIHGNLIDAFRGAMHNGFVLNWSIAMECGSCEASGGLCGYNTTNITKPEFLCFCEHGYTRSSNGLCQKGKCYLKILF